MSSLNCITIDPQRPAKAAVIWLHGLGADGNDFAPIIPQLQLPEELAIRFIFPNAPSIPVTINNGYVMPAWYDILEMSIDRKVDSAQLIQSSKAIQNIIDQQIAQGINSQHIILAGFSQGGAVCYEAALSYPKPLAGLLALSTYFATADSLRVNPANQSIPVQIFHGIQDSVVPEALGKKALQQLQSKEVDANYQTFNMDHEVCLAEINAISEWIKKILTKNLPIKTHTW